MCRTSRTRKSKPTKSPVVQEQARGRLVKVVAEEDGKVCDNKTRSSVYVFLPLRDTRTNSARSSSRKAHVQAHFPASRKNNALPSVRSLIWVVTRTWENVVEGADGTISSTIEGLLEAGKRKR